MTIDELAQQIPLICAQYGLSDVSFDTECIYDLGTLSSLLQLILDECLPELPIRVREELSSDKSQYIATLATDQAAVVFSTPTDDDWLSDAFFEQLETMPAAFGSDKRLYSINPAVGLTGQEAWYFCGTETQLHAARKAGIPLVFPGEDFMETDEYRKYNDE